MMPEESLLNRIKTLNNREDYHGALKALDGISEKYADNPYYCVRRGIALYHLHREDESLFSGSKKHRKTGLKK